MLTSNRDAARPEAAARARSCSLSGKGWDLSGIEMSGESAKQAQVRTGAQVFVGDILDAQFAPNLST